MKKHAIYIAIVLLLVAVCFCACVDNSEIMRNIAIMLRQDYSVIKVSVTSDKGGIVLSGDYVFTSQGEKITVEYSYERLSVFNIDGGFSAPESFKETLEGTAVVENDVIVSVDGDSIDPQQLSDLNAKSLTFRQSFFKNVKTTGYTFVADVVDADGFFGTTDFDGKNLKIKVGFRSSIDSLSLTYDVGDDETVTITYKFTK